MVKNEVDMVRECLMRQVGARAVGVELADIEWLMGAEHNVWKVRAAGGSEWWVILRPEERAYPVDVWTHPEGLFTYHIGLAFRHWDALGGIDVVGPALPNRYPC
jgi:hypothetical protein